jgi:hypothetical protein
MAEVRNMKQLIVLCGQHCGYCKKAKMLISRALVNEPKFAALDISYICNESPESAPYPHTLLPAFFCGRKRVFEGNPSMADIVSILRNCYE